MSKRPSVKDRTLSKRTKAFYAKKKAILALELYFSLYFTTLKVPKYNDKYLIETLDNVNALIDAFFPMSDDKKIHLALKLQPIIKNAFESQKNLASIF